MKLFRVIRLVTEIDAAAAFYGSIFNQKGTRVSSGRHYFQLGQTILACYDPAADGDDVGTPPVFHENQYIYFSTNELEAVHQRMLASNAQSCDEEIQNMPWGERLFYARDPFGSPICFVDEETAFTG